FDQLLARRLRARLQHDEGLDRFAAVLVSDADHGAFLYRRVREEYVFDFVRVDVVAADKEHVFLALDDVKVPVLVHPRDVARVHPAVTQRLRRLFGLVPVTLHDHRPAYAQFALLALRQFALAGFQINDFALDAGDRQSDAARLALRERRSRSADRG